MKIRKIIYIIKFVWFIIRNLDIYFLREAKFCLTTIKFLISKMRKADKSTLKRFASTHNNDKRQSLQIKSDRGICNNCILYECEYRNTIGKCQYASEN